MRRGLRRVALLGGVALAGLSASRSLVAEETVEHVVQPGETLWSIAESSGVYGDPLLWPLLYRFNRDQIKDPSRIYPGQQLQIPLRPAGRERISARAEAASGRAGGEASR